MGAAMRNRRVNCGIYVSLRRNNGLYATAGTMAQRVHVFIVSTFIHRRVTWASAVWVRRSWRSTRPNDYVEIRAYGRKSGGESCGALNFVVVSENYIADSSNHRFSQRKFCDRLNSCHISISLSSTTGEQNRNCWWCDSLLGLERFIITLVIVYWPKQFRRYRHALIKNDTVAAYLNIVIAHWYCLRASHSSGGVMQRVPAVRKIDMTCHTYVRPNPRISRIGKLLLWLLGGCNRCLVLNPHLGVLSRPWLLFGHFIEGCWPSLGRCSTLSSDKANTNCGVIRTKARIVRGVRETTLWNREKENQAKILKSKGW